MTTPTHPRGEARPRSALAVSHVVVGVTALATAATMVLVGVLGSGLEGLWAGWGFMLAGPSVLFLVAAVACLLRAREDPHRSGLLSRVLGAVEVAAGVALAWGAATGVPWGDEPWRSPLLVPALLVLGVGLVAVLRPSPRRPRPL